MSTYSPITDADLARARADAAFRQKLLSENLDMLLAELARLRSVAVPTPQNAQQLREGVALAVKLADIIQSRARARGGSTASSPTP